MNPSDDEAIEALLRRQFDGPLADGGFSDRVMRQLPPRRRRKTWPLWAGAAVGVTACWLSLCATPWLQAAWRDWRGGELSAAVVVLLLAAAGMAVLALGWSLVEADDR